MMFSSHAIKQHSCENSLISPLPNVEIESLVLCEIETALKSWGARVSRKRSNGDICFSINEESLFEDGLDPSKIKFPFQENPVNKEESNRIVNREYLENLFNRMGYCIISPVSIRQKNASTIFTCAGIQSLENMIHSETPIDEKKSFVSQPVVRSQYINQITAGYMSNFINVVTYKVEPSLSDLSSMISDWLSLFEYFGCEKKDISFILHLPVLSKWGSKEMTIQMLSFMFQGLNIGEVNLIYNISQETRQNISAIEGGFGLERIKWFLQGGDFFNSDIFHGVKVNALCDDIVSFDSVLGATLLSASGVVPGIKAAEFRLRKYCKSIKYREDVLNTMVCSAYAYWSNWIFLEKGLEETITTISNEALNKKIGKNAVNAQEVYDESRLYEDSFTCFSDIQKNELGAIRINLDVRNIDSSVLEKIQELQGQIREMQHQIQELRTQANMLSKSRNEVNFEIGRNTKEEIARIELLLKERKESYKKTCYELPNHISSDLTNMRQLVHYLGDIKRYNFLPKEFEEICDNDMFTYDKESNRKIYKGSLALLRRHLLSHFLDEDIKAGCTFLDCQILDVSRNFLFYQFFIENLKSPLSLEMLQRGEWSGLTDMFNHYSYQKVQLCENSDSHDVFIEMVNKMCHALKRIGGHYRLIKESIGNTPLFSSASYTLESFSYGKNRYTPVVKMHHTTAYISERLNIKCISEKKEVRFPHILYSEVYCNDIIECFIEYHQSLEGTSFSKPFGL